MTYQGLLAKYREWMDIPSHTTNISILEGNTPLIPVPAVAAALGGGFEMWVKFEGLNPTGSFKDRGMTVAISEACREKCKNRHVRLHRQYRRFRGRLCRPGRDALHRSDPRGQGGCR